MTRTQVLTGALWLWGAASLYGLPVLVAALRNAGRLRRVALLTLVGGWSGVLWLVALQLAVTSPRRRVPRRDRDEAAWAAVGGRTAALPQPLRSWSGSS